MDDGREGWKAQPFKFVPVDTIKSGKFKVPADKPKKNKSDTQARAFEENFEEVESDDDLPF